MFKRLLEEIKANGLFNFIKTKKIEFFYKKKFYRLGIYINPRSYNEAQVNQISINKDSHPNEATAFRQIKLGLNIRGVNATDINLLDIGCGFGKVLCYGIKHNFNQVIGIDLDKSAVEIAINNCTLMQKAGYKTTFEVLYSDASNYEIPYSINVIFLANPFGEATIKQVLGNIIDSCVKHQKELHLVYSAPFYQNVFTAFNENCTKLYEISNGKRASTCISVFKIHSGKKI